MTVSVERLLQRKILNLKAKLHSPKMRSFGRSVLTGTATFVLSGAALWGVPLPLAAMAVGVLPMGIKPIGALGAAVGYGIFFGARGSLGALWSAGMLLLTASARLQTSRLLPWLGGCLTALSNLVFQTLGLEEGNLSVFALQVGTAAVGTLLFFHCRERKKTHIPLLAVEVFALGCIHRGPALFALGAALGALPISTALLWAAGAELAGNVSVPLSIVVGITALGRCLPWKAGCKRCLSPVLGTAGAMVAFRHFDPWLAVCLPLGAALGGALPKIYSQPKQGSTACAQVSLEAMARLLARMQQSLLETSLPSIDEPAFVDKIRTNACGCCSARDNCNRESSISENLLHGDLSFRCRKTGRVLRELQTTQEQINQLKLNHSRQNEYRMALVQQYGYLSSLMELLADRLAGREPEPKPSYRIRICARSRKKESANGDRCLAFAGNGCRFYVLLCDGMGTGRGAAGEADSTALLLRGMLQAGMPPQYALGAVNSQLALRQMAGAVSIDLAEIRLDTGRAAVYKWGAAPSWLLRRGKPQQVGAPSPPPGLNMDGTGQSVFRLNLGRGEMLILISDGVRSPEELMRSAFEVDPEPAQMAEALLRNLPEGSDDATAAAIVLSPYSQSE